VKLLLQSWFGGAGALPNTPLEYTDNHRTCFNYQIA
jgi:hypothetical protein